MSTPSCITNHKTKTDSCSATGSGIIVSTDTTLPAYFALNDCFEVNILFSIAGISVARKQAIASVMPAVRQTVADSGDQPVPCATQCLLMANSCLFSAVKGVIPLHICCQQVRYIYSHSQSCPDILGVCEKYFYMCINR